MEKEKRKRFDPHDYDYLNEDIPLVGWCWEFSRRSQEHKLYWKQYAALERKRKENKISDLEVWEFEQEKGIFRNVLDTKDPDEKWDNRYVNHKGPSKSFPTSVINLKWRASWEPESVHAVKYLGKSSYRGFKGPFCKVYINEAHYALNPYAEPEVGYDSKEKKRIITYKQDYVSVHPIEEVVNNFGNENVVLALVDLSAPENIDALLSTLKRDFLFWRKTLNLPKNRDAKTLTKNKNALIGKSKIWNLGMHLLP